MAIFWVTQCKSHPLYCKGASALIINYWILIKVGGGTCCWGGSSSNKAHMWNRQYVTRDLYRDNFCPGPIIVLPRICHWCLWDLIGVTLACEDTNSLQSKREANLCWCCRKQMKLSKCSCNLFCLSFRTQCLVRTSWSPFLFLCKPKSISWKKFRFLYKRFRNEWRIICNPSKGIVCFFFAGPGTPSGHSQASSVVWFALVGEKI